MSPSQQQQRIAVNPEELRNQVIILEAELKNAETELFTFKQVGDKERNMWRWLIEQLVDPSRSRTNLNEWLTAHKSHQAAQVAIKDIELAKKKASVAIARAMLEQAEGKPPSSGKLIVS